MRSLRLVLVVMCLVWVAGCGDSNARGGDSGPSSDVDGGDDDAMVDATTDAAQCPGDCDDDDACTVDSCDNTTGRCVHEPAVEVCDAIDNDCDAMVDEALALTAWYIDRDADRRGDLNAEPVMSCGMVEGHSIYNDDCNDNDRAIRPTVTEICNTFDDDCDALIDENVSVMHFTDADRDGRGAGLPIAICAGTAGFSQFNDDCDDTNPQVHPGLVDICDALDNDCDEAIDELAGCAG